MRPTGNETGVKMNASVIDYLRVCTDDGVDGALTGPPTEASEPLPVLSARLMHYWKVQLVRPVSARRLTLEATCARARSGHASVTALLTPALGDVDEDIVFRATSAYLGASKAAGMHLGTVAEVAAGWIRRRLALNCSAVFAALLATGEAGIFELLLPLRQSLEPGDVDRVRQLLSGTRVAVVSAFLEEWTALLEQSVSQATAGGARHLSPR